MFNASYQGIRAAIQPTGPKQQPSIRPREFNDLGGGLASATSSHPRQSAAPQQQLPSCRHPFQVVPQFYTAHKLRSLTNTLHGQVPTFAMVRPQPEERVPCTVQSLH